VYSSQKAAAREAHRRLCGLSIKLQVRSTNDLRHLALTLHRSPSPAAILREPGARSDQLWRMTGSVIAATLVSYGLGDDRLGRLERTVTP
jgi:hypothetical protein